MAKIAIQYDQGNLEEAKVVLDGMNITRSLSSINVHLDAERYPSVDLGINVSSLRLDIRDAEICINDIAIPDSLKKALYGYLHETYGQEEDEPAPKKK